MKNWRPFLFPYHGPGSVPQGLSSFHPAAFTVPGRTQPGNNPRQGVPVAWCPLAHQKHTAAPCLGPSWGLQQCGARKARHFSPGKSLKNGLLRYALTERDQGAGSHPPPKGGEAPKKSKRNEVKKAKSTTRRKAKPAGPSGRRRKRGCCRWRERQKKQRKRSPRRRRC